MKFSQMPYERPDLEAVKKQLAALTERLEKAESYEAARAVFLEKEEEGKHVDTLATLVNVRQSIDTRDQFYDDEMQFWNAAAPERTRSLWRVRLWMCISTSAPIRTLPRRR